MLLSGLENRPTDGKVIIFTTQLYYKPYTVFVYAYRAGTNHVQSYVTTCDATWPRVCAAALAGRWSAGHPVDSG